MLHLERVEVLNEGEHVAHALFGVFELPELDEEHVVQGVEVRFHIADSYSLCKLIINRFHLYIKFRAFRVEIYLIVFKLGRIFS